MGSGGSILSPPEPVRAKKTVHKPQLDEPKEIFISLSSADFVQGPASPASGFSNNALNDRRGDAVDSYGRPTAPVGDAPPAMQMPDALRRRLENRARERREGKEEKEKGRDEKDRGKAPRDEGPSSRGAFPHREVPSLVAMRHLTEGRQGAQCANGLVTPRVTRPRSPGHSTEGYPSGHNTNSVTHTMSGQTSCPTASRKKAQPAASEEEGGRQMFDKNTLRMVHRDLFTEAVRRYR